MAAPAAIAPPGPQRYAGRTKPPGRTPTRTPGRTPGARTTVVRPTAATPPRGPRARHRHAGRRPPALYWWEQNSGVLRLALDRSTPEPVRLASPWSTPEQL